MSVTSNSGGTYLSNINISPTAPVFNDDSISFTITGAEIFQPADYNWQAW